MNTLAMQIEDKFYAILVEKGYPQDRIARQYQIDDYLADFAILPPGLAQEPLAIFEVKRSVGTAREWLSRSTDVRRINEIFSFPKFIYAADENQLFPFDLESTANTENAFPSYEELLEAWLKRRTFFTELKLRNFMLFQSAEFHFGSKLNIIIGENGSGKSQILRLLYSISRALVYLPAETDNCVKLDYSRLALKEIFKAGEYEKFISLSKWGSQENANVQFGISKNKGSEEFSIGKSIICDVSGLKTMRSVCFAPEAAVFLPTHELLSIFPGFNSLGQIYREKWAFDQTYSDCMAYLGLPVIPSQSQFAHDIIEEVEKAIHGHIYLKESGKRFLMRMENTGAVLEIPTVGEGWRKFGQLLQLINTGAIYPGSILFWDEPEAQLNPALLTVLASVIIELANLGVQVFLTTHSLFFLRELDMRIKETKELKKGEVQYFNFLKPGDVEQGDTPEDLNDILLLDESLKQSDRYLEGDF